MYTAKLEELDFDKSSDREQKGMFACGCFCEMWQYITEQCVEFRIRKHTKFRKGTRNLTSGISY